MDNFVIGTIQENIKTLSSELQVLNSNTPSKLSDLSDVSAVTPADGDTLVYNATDDIFEPKAQSGGSGGSSITELDDIPGVTITNAQDNQFLKYSGGNWINSDVVGGGAGTLNELSGVNIDTTILVNGNALIYNNGEWSAGDITYTETDPVFNAHTVSNITNGTGFLKNNGSGIWAYDNNTYLTNAEIYGSGTYTVAIGISAGNTTQGESAVAIGFNAGETTQGGAAIALGTFAGQTTQGNAAIAIGGLAGNSGQGNSAIALGNLAGNSGQKDYAVALGFGAGQTTQGDYAVALGHSAGNTNQGDNSVAIGYQAGAQGQGGNSVAIGYRANNSMNNHANTVVINGSGEPLNPEGPGSTYITPIRSSTATEVLYYNPDSGEVTTGVLPASSGGGGTDNLIDLTDTDISTPQDNQVLKYLDGKWRNLEEGITFNSLPYGSFALKDDEQAVQTFPAGVATPTKYDRVILLNKMIIYDSAAVEITGNEATEMQYFGVQTTTDYILNWVGVLKGSNPVWANMALEDLEGNVVQKSVGNVVYRNSGTVEGFATFQIMARLEAGKKYTIKIQSQNESSTTTEYPYSDSESPWQFNLQVYAIGSVTEGAAGTSPGGVPAPPVISTEFTLPTNVLANYDFRTYTLSVANVIDSDGDVIFTTIGSGNISFTSAEGVYTSSDPDRYLSKSDGLLPIPSGNFSLEFYIKFGPITTNVDHVFFQYNAGADITLEGFIGQDGKLYFQTRNGPNNLRLVYFDPFDTEATLANWDSTNFNHFVITWDGSGTEKLYHDGSLVTKNLTQYSGNVSYGQNLTFATLYLGGAFPGVPRDNIDDTIKFHRLYDGALSPADVSYLFDNREVSGVFKDVTNYALVSNNATGTETRWLSVVPAPTVIPITDFTLPTNMLANYDFRTYTLSGTDVIDSNDGSVIGTTVGNGVELSSDNGLSTTSTSHISLNPISWTQDFTIEIYFKCPTLSDAPSQNFNPIFSSYLSANQSNEIVIDRNGTTEGARFYMHINGFLTGIVSTGSVAGFNGTFGHLVCTHSSTNGRQMYVNGFLQSTTIVNDAYYNFGSDQAWNYTFLGAAPYRPPPYIDNGIESIKNFKIFNRVLTQDEVYTLYTNRDEIYGQTGTVTDVTNYHLVSGNADGTETKWVSAAAAGTVCKIHILPFTDAETVDVDSDTYIDTVSKTFTKTAGTNLFGEVHINYTIDGSGSDTFQARLNFSDNPPITGGDYDIVYYPYIGGGNRSGDINGVAVYTDGTGTSNAGSQSISLQAKRSSSDDIITFKAGFFKVTEIWA